MAFTEPRIRWAFLGSDPIALPVLGHLIACTESRLVAVWTQPDRAVGRGQRVQAGPIKTWASERGIPVHQPDRMDASDPIRLAEAGVDLVLVMAYGQILKQPFLDAPALGCFNLHTSRLPAFRGASPIQTAVASGATETAVTLMRVVLELDAGPVVDAEPVPVGALDTALEVEQALSKACVPLMARHWARMLAGTVETRPQEAAAATYCRRLEREDGRLDFSSSAVSLAARIRGLFPWPACQIEVGGVPIKVALASALPGDCGGESPGTVIGLQTGGLAVATGAGVLLLHRLQRPGGKLLDAPEFLRGFPIPPGLVLASQSMPPLVSTKPFPWKKRTVG